MTTKMKTLLQNYLILVIGLILATPANARDFTVLNEDSVNILYHSENESYAIVLPNNYSGHVRIPAKVIFENCEYVVNGMQSRCFSGCLSLTSVIIPETFTTIPEFSFWNCTSLERISLPNTILKIEQSAFNNCNHLTSIELPNSVQLIEFDAFYDCSALKSITIPKSVQSIGNTAFFNCKSLETVISEIERPFVTDAFYNISTDAILYVPNGTKEIYQRTEGWDEFKEIIELDPVGEGLGITLNSGLQTFYVDKDLDFSSIGGPQAYIASGFNPTTGEVWLSRVEYVPANTGLLLQGVVGQSYLVPFSESNFVYSNLLVGVTEETTISSGYLFNNGVFEAVDGAKTLSKGDVYLNIANTGKKLLKVKFTDTANDISNIESATKGNNIWYTLQGTRLANKPIQHGVYIHHGRKVVVK